MLAVLSPAKRLDFDQDAWGSAGGANRSVEMSALRFNPQTKQLIKVLREKSRDEIAGMMALSDDLADLNYQRYRDYAFAGAKAKTQAMPAVQAFQGDVYIGLDAASLTEDQLGSANERLRILSGLYGLLRPFDGVQAYRLEMGTKLATEKGTNLYQFWGEDIAKTIAKDLKPMSEKRLVNLASNEYFKAVKTKVLPAPVVTIHFKEIKEGTPKVISFMAKKARGLMARYIAVNEIDQADALKDFNVADYRFDPQGSDEFNWTFTREFRTVAQERGE